MRSLEFIDPRYLLSCSRLQSHLVPFLALDGTGAGGAFFLGKSSYADVNRYTGMEYFEKGLYSIAEASRLTGIDARSVSRWLQGYHYQRSGKRKDSPPVIASDYKPIDGKPALSFLDMMELRLVKKFRKHGLSFRKIRIAHERASKILSSRHPFASRKFVPDGRTILLQIANEEQDRDLLDLVNAQYAMADILSPLLLDGIDFEGELPARWRPANGILVDPRHAFGRPVVASCSIPSATLFAAYTAERSIEKVAKWYEVEPTEVKQAVDFESRSAA